MNTKPVSFDSSRCWSIGFVLFLLLNLILLIRPTEYFPELHDLPVYETAIVACLVFSIPSILSFLAYRSLLKNPMNCCVLVLFGSVVLSHLLQLNLSNARDSAIAFGKVLVYYFVLLASVDNLKRYRCFLAWLVCLIAVLAILALLQYHEWVDLSCLKSYQHLNVDEETGAELLVVRLRSNGYFNDPNDFSLLLSTGMVLSLFWLYETSNRLHQLFLLLFVSVMGYAFVLTQSRGGLLALLASLLILFRNKYGLKKSLALVAVVALPVLVFSERQANLDLVNSNDTGHERIKLWQEGFELFRESPVFGIGHGEYAERVLLVAHNSFIHCFAELGLLGGACFVGMFYCAIVPLVHLSRAGNDGMASRARLRHCLLAIVVAYGVGLFSLSRAYVPPTYLIFGLAASFLALDPETRLLAAGNRITTHLLTRIAASSMVILFAIYLFIKVFAH